MRSISSQTRKEFEYIIVDGASTDGSVEVIKSFVETFRGKIRWISEPDNGIYSAMNKGIKMASSEYVQFLNSGDCLATEDVVDKMYMALEKKGRPSILYGNMLKDLPNGQIVRDRGFAGEGITLLGMYRGCLNHSPAFILRTLFEKYGNYDETLRICSDWKWYLKAIVLGEEKPQYVDIDVSLFDMTGISETNKDLLNKERNALLRDMIPNGILTDYDRWYSSIKVSERLQKSPLIWRCIVFIERLLFKIEKKNAKRVKR